MSKDEIFNKIKGVLVSEFECDSSKVVPEAQLYQDLDLDSIDAIDLVVRLQQMTGLKVSAEDFKQIRTLGDVVDVIARLAIDQRPGV